MASEPAPALSPAPEPVSAPVEAVAEVEAPATVAEPELVAIDAEALTAAAVSARENNDTSRMMDALNREWFVGTANVDNRSNVLIQVKRGDAIREAYLSTAVFTPEAARAAINDLDGAMK